MNWDAISAIGELVGAVAVVITLLHLSRQIRMANRQGEVEAFRHTWDNLNQLCDVFAESPEKADMILRGRAELGALTPQERMIFDHIHLRMLNTLESWHLQIAKTSRAGAYRDQQLRNLAGIAGGYLSYPGTRQLWTELRSYFEPIQGIVDTELSGTPDP